jgi:quercetin dioxygenase-like cupin family protein
MLSEGSRCDSGYPDVEAVGCDRRVGVLLPDGYRIAHPEGLIDAAMAKYTKKNLREVENAAPRFDMPAEMQARFARHALGGETLGLSLFTLAPNFRIPFGHKHEHQEEVYVVLRGGGRVAVEGEDQPVELAEGDAVRFDRDTMRTMEAGPDGMEYVAFGAGTDPLDAEMSPAWWGDHD